MAGQTYDTIVLGVGGMGSAVCYHLARRGQRVVGIERHDIPHEFGSSHGSSRVIRKAYFEDPRYVPLLHRAYALWRELELESGESLLTLCGGLNMGPPGHACIVGVLDSVARHRLPHEVLSEHEIRSRFPAFRPAAGDIGVFETDAGFLVPERCVSAHVRLAVRHGAQILTSCTSRAVERSSAGWSVHTDQGAFTAERLVLTLGPWLAQHELQLGPRSPLQVERQVQLWFEPRNAALHAIGRMPVFIHFGEAGSFYGIPASPGGGVKVCRHHGGATVTPDDVDRRVSERDEADVRAYLRRHLPGADGPLVAGKVCLYTNTPDGHFVIGTRPDDVSVIVAGGFSGHGFKFASVVGEIVADLAIAGRTAHDIEMFSPARFATA